MMSLHGSLQLWPTRSSPDRSSAVAARDGSRDGQSGPLSAGGRGPQASPYPFSYRMLKLPKSYPRGVLSSRMLQT